MKKLLTIAAIAAASTALAVESSNTFGILRVDSSAAETIVAVPWEGAGATGESANKILVKDVIKTANLTRGLDAQGTNGDQLYYYADDSYKTWLLNNEGEWVGARIVMTGKTVEVGTNSDTLSRGGALILVRKNPTKIVDEETVANPFYLYGQYTIAGASVKPVANGTSLIAPPSTAEAGFDLNGDGVMTGSTPANGDYIIVDLGTVLTYNTVEGKKKWSKASTTFDLATGFTTTYDTTAAVIPSGKGVWYVSTGDSVPTFNF